MEFNVKWLRLCELPFKAVAQVCAVRRASDAWQGGSLQRRQNVFSVNSVESVKVVMRTAATVLLYESLLGPVLLTWCGSVAVLCLFFAGSVIDLAWGRREMAKRTP